MDQQQETSNGWRWAAIGLGGVALIAAIVALVLAIDNGNDSATESQVDQSVSQLDRRLDKIEATAVAAGDTGKQAEKKLSKAEKNAQGKQAKNESEISNLSDRISSLEGKV
ncbi:MAG: hypothetical protein E4H22_02220, partial [Solirubrobacterales bacterium]